MDEAKSNQLYALSISTCFERKIVGLINTEIGDELTSEGLNFSKGLMNEFDPKRY
jgi:hypothetical protein